MSRHLIANQEDVCAWRGDAAAMNYDTDWRGGFAPRIRAAAVFAHLAMRPPAVAALLPIPKLFPRILTLGARPSGSPPRWLPPLELSVHGGAAAAGSPAIDSLSTLAIVYCCVVMVLAYAARGASGFGAAAAMPLLGLVVPLKILVPAWTLIGIAAGVALLGEDRHRVAWKEMAKLVPGCLLGIAVGLYVFTLLSSDTLAKWLGVLVLLYGLYSLFGTFRADSKVRMPPRAAAALGGFAGGMTGTVVGTMGSVFFAMYFDAVRLAKEQYRATMTSILLTLTLVRGIGYWAVGEFTREVLIATAILFPMMLVGIFIGNRFHHGMSDLTFRRTVSGALIASGLALLVK